MNKFCLIFASFFLFSVHASAFDRLEIVRTDSLDYLFGVTEKISSKDSEENDNSSHTVIKTEKLYLKVFSIWLSLFAFLFASIFLVAAGSFKSKELVLVSVWVSAVALAVELLLLLVLVWVLIQSTQAFFITLGIVVFLFLLAFFIAKLIKKRKNNSI